MSLSKRIAVILIVVTFLAPVSAMQKKVPFKALIFTAEQSPQIQFAAARVKASVMKRGILVSEHTLPQLPLYKDFPRIIISERMDIIDTLLKKSQGTPLPELRPEGFSIRRTPNDKTIWVIGTDTVGTMYGALRLAEIIELTNDINAVSDIDVNPKTPVRGIRLNLPLDARTPSYDDTGDAFVQNIPQVWEMNFWKQMIDQMALFHYNRLTLCNPHPYPSMIKLIDFPDIALENVMASSQPPVAEPGVWGEPFGVSDNVLSDLRTIRKMSIEEKILFWQEVMGHAADRGIEVYFLTWNPVLNAAKGKYGITDDMTNSKTEEYLRQCVRQMFLSYPDLAGLGLALVPSPAGTDEKVQWLYNTYAEPVREAIYPNPNRKISVIHDLAESDIAAAVRHFVSRVPFPVELTDAYARGRTLTSTHPGLHYQLNQSLQENKQKIIWTLYNEDMYIFRWGDPDFAREMIQSMPSETLEGIELAANGYFWGKDFFTLTPDEKEQLEIQKHWYSFMIWARTAYNPRLDREFFISQIQYEMPQADAEALYEAWKTASSIPGLVSRFHWAPSAGGWTPEGCFDQKTFHDVFDFIDHPTMPGQDILTIREYAEKFVNRQPFESHVTPPDIIAQLHQNAGAALALATLLEEKMQSPSRRLENTIADIEALAHLGKYYASKIQAALDIHFYDITRDHQYKRTAGRAIRQAAREWEIYAQTASSHYRPQMLARSQMLDWMQLLEDVRNDIQLIRNFKEEEDPGSLDAFDLDLEREP